MTDSKIGTTDFIGMYEATENREFLDRALKAASAYGEREYVLSMRDDELDYNGKLMALKYAITHGKANYLFSQYTPIGQLYRELFWDSDVDPVFLMILPKEMPFIHDRVCRAVIGNPFSAYDNIELAEERVSNVYKGIVRAIINHNTRTDVIDTRIEPLARAVDMLDEARAAYRPLIERVINKFPEEARVPVQRFTEQLGIELENIEQSSK